MTILLYDYCELEERAARHLKAWKVWHITLYSLTAILGILNYTFLQSTMQLVDNNCVLYPRKLAFHMVEIPNIDIRPVNYTENATLSDSEKVENKLNEHEIDDKAQTTVAVPTDNGTITEDKAKTVKREVPSNETIDDFDTTITVNNVTVVIGNETHRLALDTSRTLFGLDNDCQFAEYMPLMSTVFAIVWITFFTMCPGGGHVRSGLQQPWRILTPALLFAIVLVGLTGYSYSRTDGGLHAFCSSFYNFTNATTCSSVNPFVENAWNASWGFGGRAGAARAASAGAWAGWACVATLLLARCIAAPDFNVKRTGVYLTKDPEQKLTAYLKKSPRRSLRSTQSSPNKRDNASIKSEPTITTELVTASVEQGQDSVPTSLTVTPIKHPQRGEMMEMTYTPQEQHNERSSTPH